MEEEKYDRMLWNASRAAVLLGIVIVLAACCGGILLIRDVVMS